MDFKEVKEIPNFNGYYVSKNGQVYSSKLNKFVLLKPSYRKGYLFVKLYNNLQKRVFIGIHKLVALTYIPTKDTSLEINHINYKRDDNRVENLEWISHLNNVRYSRHTGLRVIWDNGIIREFTHVSDFEKEFGWKSGNVAKYIREYHSYSKKHKCRFEYI